MTNDDHKERDATSVAQLVKNMRDNLAAHLEFQELNALITRKKFLSLRSQGFTEQQAIELCKGIL